MAKNCFKCKQCLPLEQFYVHPRMKDGHLNKCKDCARSDIKSKRLERRSYYLRFDRDRDNLPHRVAQRQKYQNTVAGKAAKKRASANYRVRYPDKTLAHDALNNAVRDRLIQKKPCEICGAGEVEGHHFDYSRPLDVIWLCTKHHAACHKIKRNENRASLEAAT